MAIYNPPIEDLPIFDTSVFVNEDNGLSIAEGDARYLRFPVSQGGETISGALVVSGTTTVDTIAGSAVGTAVSLYNEGTRSGAINIGTGTTAKNINIGTVGGAGSTTVSIAGSTITVGSANSSFVNCNPAIASALNLGSTMTGGTVRIGGSTGGTTTIDIGSGASQTGAISIGSGASTKAITIGGTSGGNTTINGGTINIAGSGGSTTTISNTGILSLQNGSSSAMNIGTNKTGGNIDIGQSGATSSTTTINIGTGTLNTGAINIGGGTSTLTIQRPIQLSSGADPASSTSAIGYIYPIITTTSIAIAVPANTYTWSTGARSLGIGVWMLSLGATIVADFTPQNYVYNMGFMSSAPTTGDSATASSAPANTIASINGNLRDSDPITITNGTYIYNVGGVVVNNYGGTFNNVYGIFNADWSVAGTIAMTELSIRAVKIG